VDPSKKPTGKNRNKSLGENPYEGNNSIFNKQNSSGKGKKSSKADLRMKKHHSTNPF